MGKTTSQELDAILMELRLIRETQLVNVRDIEKLKVKTGLWSAIVSATVTLIAIVWKSW